MVANSLLRTNARNQLDGNIFKSKWLAMLAVCAVLPVVEAAAASMFVFGAVVILIVTGPFMYGMARTTVECVEGDKWEFSHTFVAFSENFGHSAMLGFLQFLFTFLWSLLLIVPGIVKSYSYAMAFYIQQERTNKGKEPIECITESRQMMDGHKWQLFCLDLSFLGWYIVGALCLGIGIFFVAPYHQMARANFYEALKAELTPAAPVMPVAPIAPVMPMVEGDTEQPVKQPVDGEENRQDDEGKEV